MIFVAVGKKWLPLVRVKWTDLENEEDALRHLAGI